MNTLNERDLFHVLSRLPKDVFEMLANDSRLILAGGFVRAVVASEDPSDIDIWGSSVEVLELAAYKLKDRRKERGEVTSMHQTANAITLLTNGRLPVQFILRWLFDSTTECAESFDFTVCQAAVQFCPIAPPKTRAIAVSAISASFYEDLAARRLVYTAPARDEDAGGSMLRVLKYLRRGYNIQVDSLAAVCSRLFRGLWIDDDRWKDEGERTTMITALLRAVDPLIQIDGLELSRDDDHNPKRAA